MTHIITSTTSSFLSFAGLLNSLRRLFAGGILLHFAPADATGDLSGRLRHDIGLSDACSDRVSDEVSRDIMRRSY